MAKTKLIVKDNQVLVDADVLFEQIEQANGDWKSIKASYDTLKASLQVEEEEE
jgi:hypothetical protein